MQQTTLIPMLGTSQVDELVLYPQTTIQDALPTIAANGALHPLSKALIELTRKSMGLTNTRDEADDLCNVIRDETIALCCWHLIVGKDRDIFRLYCLVEPPLPIEKFSNALITCQSYHSRYRFGRLYPYIPEGPEGNTEFRLCFEVQLDLSTGTTVDFLKTLIASHIGSICDFLKTPPVQKLLVPAQPRKRSKTTTKQESSQQK